MLRFFQNDKRCGNFKMAKNLKVERLSKNSRYDFIQKPTRSDAFSIRNQSYSVSSSSVSSSIFRSIAEKNVSRTREPRTAFESQTSRYGFLQNLLEVTPFLQETKVALSIRAPSVRVFFAAKRRKMYREPLNHSPPLNHELLDTVSTKPTRSDERQNSMSN